MFKVEMSAISVLFVCHGNICRSTMAQQYLAQTVLKATATDSPLKRIKHIDSCGVGDDDLGSQPDPGTQTVLQNHGMPKLSHVARLFELVGSSTSAWIEEICSVINSRTAIAGAIIGLLLVFYDSKSIGFLKVFLPEVLFVQTAF